MKKLLLLPAISLMGLYGTETPIVEDAFTKVYESNAWLSNKSRSGPGSSLEKTKTVRVELPKLCREFGITTMLDAPCGDFFWMKEIIHELGLTSYRGVDIVREIVENNRRLFSAPGVTFDQLDLINGEIPKVDLILCRDCFIHLPTVDIWRALKNFKNSGSKYILMNTFERKRPYKNIRNYEEVKGGGWRPINFCRAPFNFPAPLATIQEDWEHPWDDKCLALWRLDDIIIPE